MLLGVLLYLPSLGLGFMADDWFHLALIEELAFMPERADWDLFSFVTRSEDAVFTPWWASDSFTAAFFRPLAALSHHLDHHIFGRWAPGHHLTSLFLWGLLLVAVMAFFNTLARDSGRGPLVVLLAGVFYAVDDAHAWNVSWLSNRNALLCVLFSLLSLWFHHRGRRDGNLLLLLSSSLLFVVALLGGEAAIALLMWLIAYELVLGEGGLRIRLCALAPVVLISLAYLLAWSHFGFGASGSDLYVSPFDRPLAFVGEAAIERIPLLIMAMFWPIPAELSFLFPEQALLVRCLAWVCALLVAALLVPLLRRDPVARFLAVGGLLSLLPMAGTFAHNRLLLFATVASSWLVAVGLLDWLSRARRKAEGRRWSATARLGALLAFLVAVVHGPGAIAGSLLAQHMLNQLAESGHSYALEAELPELEGARAFTLNSIDPISPTYLPLIRGLEVGSVPEAYASLSVVPGDQLMTRTGERSFRLEAGRPGYLRTAWEGLFRAQQQPVAGEQFARGEFVVRAVRVEQGELLEIEVELARSLDDPRTVLLAWDGQRMARIQPPPIGACRRLPLPGGYGIHLPFPAYPAPAKDCAESVGFVESSQSIAPAAGSAEVAGNAPAGSSLSGSVGAGRPEPARSVASAELGPCQLELWAEGKWSSFHQLQCPRDRSLNLLSVGDVGRSGEILTASVAEMQRSCADGSCQLMLIAGDLLYGPGSLAEQAWRGVWDDGLARVGLPGLAVLGNHEYRHEPGPERKREVLFAAHGRKGLALPAANYAARLRMGDQTLLSVAALDTDSVALPGDDKPGLGLDALAEACAQQAPVVVLGHHPASSQGLHHSHEAWLERKLRRLLVETAAGGCEILLYASGHDHDLQAYTPACEEPGMPAQVVSGVVARGYRARGSSHLSPCPIPGARSSYHAGPRAAGGFIRIELELDSGEARAVLVDVPRPGESEQLDVLRWSFPARKGQ
ncbi:MAG: hypothetical protein CMP23_09395 [Rickettsiales bacterium]|nr:hypothetical protein [Rickettsiales bacterium]